MRILFITHHYLTIVGGGSFASRAYINAFAEVADDMTLLYPVKEGQDVFPEINKKINLVPVKYDIPNWRKLVHVLTGKVHRYYNVAPHYIKTGHYDVVVFDNSKTSFQLIDIAHQSECKTIVINHNFEYEYMRDNSRGILRPFNLFWCKRFEKEAAQKSDLNLTLSNQDTKLLCSAFRNGDASNFRMLGTFEYASSSRKIFTKSEDCFLNCFTITGNLSALQTIESLVPWIKEYYPILKEVFPDSVLTIAGKNPNDAIKNICREKNITLIPSPASMDHIMKNANYYICPTDLGGGIKLRVMDGLKWGLPVITHAVSARGYDRFVEKGFMLSYTDTESFKKSLMKLKNKSFDKQSVYDTYRSIFSFEAGTERVRYFMDFLKDK